MCWNQQENDKKSFNQQIPTNVSATCIYANVGYLGDSSVASVGNRKNPTEDSVSHYQNNPAEEFTDIYIDNTFEPASEQWGTQRLMP